MLIEIINTSRTGSMTDDKGRRGCHTFIVKHPVKVCQSISCILISWNYDVSCLHTCWVEVLLYNNIFIGFVFCYVKLKLQSSLWIQSISHTKLLCNRWSRWKMSVNRNATTLQCTYRCSQLGYSTCFSLSLTLLKLQILFKSIPGWLFRQVGLLKCSLFKYNI